MGKITINQWLFKGREAIQRLTKSIALAAVFVPSHSIFLVVACYVFALLYMATNDLLPGMILQVVSLVGGFKDFLFSISYMGCHPSH